jgi:hypothetical protein
MSYYFSNGFYCDEVHGDSIPRNAVKITDEVYYHVLEEQSKGMMIVPCEINGVKVVPQPPLTTEQLSEFIRKDRDDLLIELDGLVNNPLRWSGYSEEYKTALSNYRKDLLNIPQQDGFPDNVVFPNLPKE